jgi:hypothetical protein
MVRPSAAAVVLLLVTAGATTAPSTLPATQPTSAPTVLDPAIHRWFDQLADPDPAVRDAAAERLMGLPVDALPRLQAIVRAADPLLPVQAAALHEIVCQAYLAGLPYAVSDRATPTPDGSPPFVMGVRHIEMPGEDSARFGVPIVERWFGFPARRQLRDGDMILGVFINRHAPLEQLPNQATHRFEDLRSAITSHPGVRDIDLSILRDGRVIRLSMTLVPQAADATGAFGADVDAFLNNRQQQANDYWQAEFAPLVDPVAAPSPDAAVSLDS